ncbi:Very-short-patch-repair endonuclease [Agrococcus baldri]|uniref:Very-short-patch-repair endonuclease n=2 Tax=Agrococcus baldri TaxID=153730 RepID=A0AA94L078_9MICO|nr:Very-short-patch-repair endonuclease [Agrococcus baldri]
MRDLRSDLLAAGGATTRVALRALGHAGRSIRAAVERGDLQSVGRRWVVLPEADQAIITALEAGGVLGGATALASYGVWVTHVPRLQIATRPSTGAGAMTTADRIWAPFEVDAKQWRVGVLDALLQHAKRVPHDDAIASIDSAWHQGLIAEEQIDELFRRLPQRCRPWRRLLEAKAQSGLETLVRVPCLERGWRVESQVAAPGGGFSDLLIDGWLYVEADGSEWHDEPKQAAKDRKRNRAITDRGDRWLRFGYADVVHDRPRTIATIAAVMAQGRPGGSAAGRACSAA